MIGTARGADVDRVRELGADEAIDAGAARFEAALVGEAVDAVVDLVGGEVLPLDRAARAHRTLEAEEPHGRGKIVLRVAAA